MKLEVGMYVKTEKGIYKINYFINNAYTQKFTYIDNLGVSNILEKNEVVKASHNIIDLIEVGDYVNSEQIKYVLEKSLISDLGNLFEEQDINSIVTKEQFESMSYKVGD